MLLKIRLLFQKVLNTENKINFKTVFKYVSIATMKNTT